MGAFTNNTGLPAEVILAIAQQGGGGGGGGEPSAYIKSASVSGNKLTLTKKDGSKVEFDMTTVVNTINAAISALETAVDGKQDAISDLSTIRTGAGKGATSVQTVNGEEPDANGNVNVSGGSGMEDDVLEIRAGGTEEAAWNKIYILFDDGMSNPHGTVNIGLSENFENGSDSIVIRFIAGAGLTINFPDYFNYTVVWANGNAPTYTEGKGYEIVITPFRDIYVIASYTEVTLPEE